ncbi:hypothetical protein FRB95_000630 [Tulasnella sp. JGI-2019a]|nr:hypothetical protein FRB95_000630 [Tulasnella sp. JGI-2019a]
MHPKSCDTPLPGILLVLCFEYLSEYDIVTAAVVCKGWLGIALDLLWRTREVPLSGILDLMSFLEREELEPPIPPESIIRVPSVGAVNPKEWISFIHQYPHKITRLRVNATLDKHAIHFLRQLLEMYGGTLCPNAKSVHVLALACIDDVIPSYLPILFRSSVTHIAIGDHDGTEKIGAACREVARACPDITKLTTTRPFPVIFQCYVDCSQFLNLRAVDLGALSWEG